ncbi:hypothetical protein GCM10011512_28720 [Tersicoccus solisilvae]|uniref:DUF4352 domain-containing protein n=1 Tax=Tersicoccus solisilvae TaxID=1882339 RepID=A0ABQ1PNT3_9MICC|nr:hypothetical protein GCM10011512_28720 [Tersicoccus solisilvae]
MLAGEIAGPAVRLTIQATNRGSEPVNLDLFVVNAYVGPELTPAGNVTQPGGRPFTGTLAPGADATGVYLFSIPTDQRGRVRVTVDYRAQEPRVVFEGSLAG